MTRSYIVRCTLFFLLAVLAGTDRTNLLAAPPAKEVNLRELDRKKWKKLTKDLRYDEVREKKKEKTNRRKPWELPNFQLPVGKEVLRVVLFVLLIGVLVFLIVRIFGKDLFMKRTKSKADSFSIEELEDHLEEADLHRYLKDALARKAYREAVRIYYLMILKELAAAGNVVLKKDKTNRNYAEELRSTTYYAPFREITLLYEYVWFGERMVSEDDFRREKMKFDPVFNLAATKN